MTAAERMRRWRALNPEKSKENKRKQRKAHPEKFREKYRRQYAKNAEKRAAAARSRRERDRDAYNAAVRARRHADPSVHRAACHARRARLKQVEGQLSAFEIKSQLMMQGFRCYYCRIRVDLIGYEVDHFVALANGGRHAASNIVIACRACNNSKNDSEPYTFMKKSGIKFCPYPRIK